MTDKNEKKEEGVKKTTPKEPEVPVETKDVRNAKETPEMIAAKEVLQENRDLLEKMSEERARNEKAVSEILLQGRSVAGQAEEPEETADEKWAREAKIRYAGTGMDPTPDA